MIAFPMIERMDDSLGLIRLERHRPPQGLVCPRCGKATRRLCCEQGYVPASRCRACEGSDTRLTGTVVEKTRQRSQAHLNDTAPTGVMSGTACEAAALDQNAGETTHAPARSHRPATLARQERQRARPLRQRSSSSHQHRLARPRRAALGGVGGHADRHPCHHLIADHVPSGSTRLDTDAWQSDRGSPPGHGTVAHGVREWARDDHGDGQRAVHGPTCEGAGAALRTSVRAFRGVHNPYRHLDVATYAAMVNAKRLTPELIRRMCLGDLSGHTGYT